MSKRSSIALDVAAALPFAILWGLTAGSTVLGLVIVAAGLSIGIGRLVTPERPPFLERASGMLIGSMAAALFHLFRVVRGF